MTPPHCFRLGAKQNETCTFTHNLSIVSLAYAPSYESIYPMKMCSGFFLRGAEIFGSQALKSLALGNEPLPGGGLPVPPTQPGSSIGGKKFRERAHNLSRKRPRLDSTLVRRAAECTAHGDVSYVLKTLSSTALHTRDERRIG